jgi:D-3-phosphoglycerate dehydrogenase
MIVCLNAVTTQRFWQLPETFERAIATRLPPGAELVVARTLPELTSALRDATIALGWPFPAAMARDANELARVHFFTSGIPESWQKSAAVVTTHRGGARAVAEHALFLTLALLRGATRATFTAWDPDGLFVPRAAERMSAAIFGAGAVGSEIARLVTALFARVTTVSRSEAPSFARILEESDVVFLALPLTAEARALTGADFFRALRPGALVVNVASGALVSEPDVLSFLARDPANRYAADVAHPEPYPEDGALRTNAQVLLTPHVGARREDAWAAIEKRTFEVLDEALGSIS